MRRYFALTALLALATTGAADASPPSIFKKNLVLSPSASWSAAVTADTNALLANGLYENNSQSLVWVVAGVDQAYITSGGIGQFFGVDVPSAAPLYIGQTNATWGQWGDPYQHQLGLGINTQPTYGLQVLGGGARIQTLNQPQNVTVTATGTTGATSWAYYVLAVDAMGNTTQPSSTISIANGNATLTSTNYNAISWTIQPAACFHIVRTTAGGTPSSTGIIATCITGNSFNDVGLTAGTFTAPTRNATGDMTIDGQLTVTANINSVSITGPLTVNGGNNSFSNANLLISGGTFQPARTTFGDANFTITGFTFNAITSSLTAARVASVSCNLGSTNSPVFMIVKDEAGGASATNTVTITPTAGTIDGSASKVCINSAFGSCRFYSRGGNCYTF